MDDQLYIRIRGRVLGPYEQEKLQALVRRGQLSQLHELSEDGVNWVRASNYPDLFVSEPIKSPTPEASEVPKGTEPTAREPVAPPQAPPRSQSPAEWYYSHNGRECGPVDFILLQQMISMGQVGSDESVWKEGMVQWTTAKQVPGLVLGPAGATGNAGTKSAEESLPMSVCKSASDARPWAQFLAMASFVYAVLSVVGGVFLLIAGANANLPPVVASGLFSLIWAGVATMGGYLLVSYSNRLGALRYGRSPVVLEKALDDLKKFWIYASMILIVLVAFVILGIVWVVAIGGSLPLDWSAM